MKSQPTCCVVLPTSLLRRLLPARSSISATIAMHIMPIIHLLPRKDVRKLRPWSTHVLTVNGNRISCQLVNRLFNQWKVKGGWMPRGPVLQKRVSSSAIAGRTAAKLTAANCSTCIQTRHASASPKSLDKCEYVPSTHFAEERLQLPAHFARTMRRIFRGHGFISAAEVVPDFLGIEVSKYHPHFLNALKLFILGHRLIFRSAYRFIAKLCNIWHH